jgi:hypothetical protein
MARIFVDSKRDISCRPRRCWCQPGWQFKIADSQRSCVNGIESCSRLRRLRAQGAPSRQCFLRKLAAGQTEHNQRPAIEQHFDADEETDYP